MSYADIVFKENCRDIIENGYSTENEKVRPVWEDGTPAYTIKKFGVVNRYDLSKEFPILTLRYTIGKMPLTKCFGYGRKNPIKFPSLIHIFGIHGWARTALSARHTVISSVLSISIKKECLTRLTGCFMI